MPNTDDLYARAADDTTHFDLLRTLCDMYGIAPPGQASSARTITDVWQGPEFTSDNTALGATATAFVYELSIAGDPAARFATASALPPGLLLNGSLIAGVPTTPGTYRMDVAVTAATGTLTRSIVIVITRDTDGDGFSDEIETALATDPSNAASVPVEAPTGPPSALTISGLSARLNFRHVRGDSLTVTGSLTLPGGFLAAGSAVVLNAGGVVRSYVLNRKGRPKRTRNELFRLSSDGRFVWRLQRATLKAALADEGLTNARANGVRTGALVTVILGGSAFERVERVNWSARADRSGTASGEK